MKINATESTSNIRKFRVFFHCSHAFRCCFVRFSSFFFSKYSPAQFVLFSIFFHQSFYFRFFFNFYDSEIIFVDVSQFPTERLISSGIFVWNDRTKKGQISSDTDAYDAQYESSNVKGWTQFYFWYEMLILEINSHPNAYASSNTRTHRDKETKERRRRGAKETRKFNLNSNNKNNNDDDDD